MQVWAEQPDADDGLQPGATADLACLGHELLLP